MKEYTRSSRIRACKLNKDDLVNLTAVLEEGFAPSDRREDLEIRAQSAGFRIESNSIQNFLGHEDLPDSLSRLSFRKIGWSDDRAIDRHVYLNLYDNYIDLDVSGPDEMWVLGKHAQVAGFLRKRRAWFWLLHEVFPFTAGVVPFWSLSVFVRFVRVGNVLYSVSAALLTLAWILATVFYFRGTFLPHTRIAIRQSRSVLSKENVTIIIAVLALLVSLVGDVVIPLLQ